MCLTVRCLFLSFRVSLHFAQYLLVLYPGHHPPCGRNRRVLNPLRTDRMRSIAPWRYTTISQVMSPTSSTTSSATSTTQNESVDIDTEPSYSCDAELDDELVGKALSSPLFIQEREEPANRRQAYHSNEESLLPAQSIFTRTSTERPVYEPSSNLSQKRKSSRDLENERIRILFDRQKRAHSHCSHIWDPEARTSSRVW